VKLVLLSCVVPFVAFASIGKVTLADGAATRVDEKGAAVALMAGTEIELNDTLKVTSGHLKIELNDGSEIALDKGGELKIDEAEFQGQDCKSFVGTLKSGSLWTKVKHLLGGAKYEVKTQRAVAGVRGTIFRVDADTLVLAAKGRRTTVVRVIEGAVGVTSKISKAVKAATPGKRTEVKGPAEISADQWEQKFIELQAGQAKIVGDDGQDLYEKAELADKEKNDAFQKWLDSQNKPTK
jgi:hypothetical protein